MFLFKKRKKAKPVDVARIRLQVEMVQVLLNNGYSWDQTLVSNPVDFTGIDVFGQEQGEDALGNLIIFVLRSGCHIGRNHAHGFFHVPSVLMGYPDIIDSCYYQEKSCYSYTG